MDEKRLLKQLAGADYRINELYNKLITELAKVGKKITDIPKDELFSFDDYPKAASDVARVLKQYTNAIQTSLVDQIKQAFDVAFQLQNAFLGSKSVLHGKAIDDVRKIAEQSFISSRLRPQRGMSLSDRVWNYTQQAKSEFEAGISQIIGDGLLKGMSAEELGRNLRQMLQRPDDVYRRYHLKKRLKDGSKRDVIEWRKKVVGDDGKVHFVKTDLEHVGRGVYRSSRQNALRLAATEINMAYRNADWVRWQHEPFVIGIRIELSNNHTLNGKPFHDMCDDLVGDYPKEFYFPGWHPRCYDESSEVLTNRGWVHFRDVLADDKILSLNSNTRGVEWVGISKYMSWNHNGYMVHFKNRSLDCLVTPEHDMVYLNKTDGRIERKPALEYRHTLGAFYRSCEYLADDVPVIIIGDTEFLFDDFCEFMGYWLSDGSACRYSQVSIAQYECEAKPLIIDCVDRMGLNPHVSDSHITFYSKAMREYLSQFGHSSDKYVPDEIKRASKRQIRIFLDAYNRCDGSTRKARPFVGNRGGVCNGSETKVYFTTSDKMEADLGELILKCGMRPSFRTDNSAGKVLKFKNGEYTINHNLHYITECKSVTASVFSKEFVHYDGIVYDLELEKNHIMYIRRNGKCFWGSNCRCTSYALTVSEDEMDKIAFLSEEDYNSYESPNRIKQMPRNFLEYCEVNAKRIVDADKRETLPYWARDNRNLIPALRKEEPKPPVRARSREEILQAASIRHQQRTTEEANAIQARWDRRFIGNVSKSGIRKMPAMPSLADIWNDRAELTFWSVKSLDYSSRHFRSGLQSVSDAQMRAVIDGTYGKRFRNAIEQQNRKIERTNKWLSGLKVDGLHDDATIRLAKYIRSYSSYKDFDFSPWRFNNLDGMDNLHNLVKAKVDFSKISPNMPRELLPKGKWLGEVDYTFDKKFFDSMPDYVKLKISDANKTSFCSGIGDSVSLFSGDQRYISPQFRKSLVYHEFGHAIFDMKNLVDNEHIVDFMLKWDKEWQKVYDAGTGFKNHQRIEMELKTQYFNERRIADVVEKMCKTSVSYNMMDVMQSISGGKYGCLNIDGHSTKYWGNGVFYHRTEFFAHISEWQHLKHYDALERIFGKEFTDEFSELWGKIMK